MKRIGKALFRIGVAFLWLVMAALGLEAYQVLRWQWMEKTNPFILARDGVVPWAGEKRTEAPPQETVAPKRYPEPSPVQEERQRAAFFVSLNREKRVSFCNVYGKQILILRRDGGVEECYPVLLGDQGARKSIADLCGAEETRRIAARLPHVFATGQPCLQTYPARADGFVKTIFYHPVRDLSGSVAQVIAFIDEDPYFKPQAEENLIWDSPFFIYKKHTQRAEHDSQMNNYGFRDDDVQIPKPAGIFRIVCVGASTTEEGPTNEFTYPNLLEKKLNTLLGGKHVENAWQRIEVINCGVAGLSSLKEMMRLPDYLALEPDLVLYYNGVNDICHGLFVEWVKGAAPWRKVLRKSRFINYYFNRWLLPGKRQIADDLDAFTFKNLHFLFQYFRDHGVDVAVCSFAYPDIERLSRTERDYYDYYHQLEWGGRYVTFATYCRTVQIYNAKLRALCAELGLYYVPVAEQLEGGTDLFGDICHMKDAGVEEKAEVIFACFRDTLVPEIRRRLPPTAAESESRPSVSQ